MCTSDMRSKLRYRGIDTVHIGVKLLYDHGGTPQWYLTKRFPSPSVNDIREEEENDCALVPCAVYPRERERETGNIITTQNKYKELKKGTYARNMHEHVMCKNNCIMGSTQSKPTNTQFFNNQTHI